MGCRRKVEFRGGNLLALFPVESKISDRVLSFRKVQLKHSDLCHVKLITASVFWHKKDVAKFSANENLAFLKSFFTFFWHYCFQFIKRLQIPDRY